MDRVAFDGQVTTDYLTPARARAAPALRAALIDADFTVQGVNSVLAPGAARSGALNVPRGTAALAAQDALAEAGSRTALIRMFLLGEAVGRSAAVQALAPLPLNDAVATGLVAVDDESVRALLDLRPHADNGGEACWWVLSDFGSDLGRGRLATDHVLGIGAASMTLARSTVRHPVRTAADIGIGCGIQSLYLSGQAKRVIGTDRNERALALAAWTAAINGLDWQLAAGDLLDPLAGERVDLLVSNPPFVPGAPPGHRFLYRDGGYDGDGICEQLVRQAPDHLTEGGWCQLLATWLHRESEPWPECVAGWLGNTGCDAWVVGRELLDPIEHVRMWTADSGAGENSDQARQWLEWFRRERIDAIGYGSISLQRTDRSDPAVRIEELGSGVGAPDGAAVAGLFDRRTRWRAVDDIESARLRAADDLVLESAATRSAQGWRTGERVLTHLGRRIPVDQATAELVAGCTGDVAIGQLLDVLAVVHGLDRALLGPLVADVVEELVEVGILDTSDARSNRP